MAHPATTLASFAPEPTGGRARLAGWLLGLALGGYFDGILLHQILQWHHLLSGLEGGGWADIRLQILADGVFHTVMYGVAAVGLWLLWRSRRALDAAGAGRLLLAQLLIGFGSWHVADAVLSHWVLQIHRIRMTAANPLLWDVLWLAAFGIVPLVVGVLLRRAQGSGGHGSGGQGSAGGGSGGRAARGTVAAILVAGLVLGSAAAASRPPSGTTMVMVWFGPGITAPEVFVAAAAVDARTVWADRSGQLWALDLADPARAGMLYRHGALVVGRSLLAAGCLAWSHPR